MAYERINHPAHYGGENNPYEAIKVIEAWRLGFCLGNAVKYICRAGAEFALGSVTATLNRSIDDLKKAKWYIEQEIMVREAKELSRNETK